MAIIEPDSLGLLYRRHAPALRLYARQWPGAGEDLVHDAFVKLARQAPPPDNVLAWLYRVVRNGALTAQRAFRRRQRHEGRAAERQPAWFEPNEGDALDAGEAAAALERLPWEQCEVIVAHLWGGLTFEEIGQVMRCSSSTAHRWYAAGIATLRERLKVPCPQSRPTRR